MTRPLKELQEIKKLLKHRSDPTDIEIATIKLSKGSYNIALASMFISIVFGAIGIVLIIAQMHSSVEVKNFNSLLIKDSTLVGLYSNELDSVKVLLSKTDEIIRLSNNQLSINEQTQRETNNIHELNSKSEISEFYIATENIKLLVWKINGYPKNNVESDSLGIFTYLNKVSFVLNSQLHNPFLLSNKYLYEDWLNVCDSINNFTFFFNFTHFSAKELNLKRRNCFVTIGELSQRLDAYMALYRWGRNNPHSKLVSKLRPATPEWYKEVRDFRRKKASGGDFL